MAGNSSDCKSKEEINSMQLKLSIASILNQENLSLEE
jgi:hypothetical protein